MVCFAYIAWQVSTRDVLLFDTVIRQWAYDQRGPVLNRIMIVITYLGNWQTVVTLGLALLLPGTRRRFGVPFVCISAASTVFYKCMKAVFARPRPDLAVRLIEESGWSFPSGHSMNCIVCYGVLIYLIRRYCTNRQAANGLTALLSLLVLSIGCSRVYVGVHYPTDVLGGWSLGLAFLLTSVLVYERVTDRDEKHGERRSLWR